MKYSLNLKSIMIIWIALASLFIVNPLLAADDDIKTVSKRLEGETAVRQRLLLRNQRFVAGLGLGNAVGNAFRTASTIGVDLNYFIRDDFSIGLNAFFALPRLTDMGDQIVAKYASTSRKSLYSEENFSAVGLGVSIEAAYVPIVGKMSLLGQSNQKYDMFLLGGIGALTQQGANVEKFRDFSALAIAPSVGVGMRVFFNPNLAVSLTLRNYIYSSVESVYAVKDAQGAYTFTGDKEWGNHFFFTLGVHTFTGNPKPSK
jgi:outer membrane beta-barrel protein